MAYKTKYGTVVRTPEEKAKRYQRQLNRGMVTETGQALTKSDKAYRNAYIKAVEECKKHFKKK